MQAEALDALQDNLRESLAKDGLSAALSALKKALPEQTEKYNLVFQLETRLNRINKDRIKGILSQEDLELAYNRLSDDILNLIANLSTADFAPPAANAANAKKSGSVLYQIPRTMKLDAEEEYRCVVRLAFNEEIIVENLDLTKDTELKPIRVSEIMEVELKDPNESPAFKIRTVNSVEQFLEESAYTEWIFYVNPTRAGKLPLLLVIAVKEYIKDRPVKREIVLEELVNVTTEVEDSIEDTATFQHTGYNFVYTTESERRTSPLITTLTQGKYSMVASVLLLVMFAAGIWALSYRLGWFNKAPKVIETPELKSKNQTKGSKRDGTSTNIEDSMSTEVSLPPDTIALDTPKLPSSNKLTKNNNNNKSNPNKPSNTLNSKPKPKPKPIPKLNDKSKPVVQTQDSAKKIASEPIAELSKVRKSGFTMVKVEGGMLLLGRHYGAKACSDTSLQINTFRIGKYEITQADWLEIMGKNPAFKKSCADCPVENVSWNDVQEFIQKASKIKGKKFRLPYEVEWEYAASGGKNPHGFVYAGSKDPAKVAWFSTVREYTHKVGLKKPNNLDIYDLSGNVREWCQGTFSPYLNCAAENENKKPLRGGSWANPRNKIKVVSRSMEKPGYRDQQSGLRLVEER
jgi:formylglycine-generating enzyme required for sulfatase activity